MCRNWSSSSTQMAGVIKQMAQMTMMDKMRTLTGLGRVAATNPAAQIMAPKIGTGKRLDLKGARKAQETERKGGTPSPPRGTRPAWSNRRLTAAAGKKSC